MKTRLRSLTLLACGLLLAAEPAHAYLHLTVSVGGTPAALQWKAPRVRWLATDRGVPGVTASQFQAEVAQAFARWEAVPTASIAFQFGGFTSAVPFEEEGLSVFGFEAAPDMDRVLGATTFVLDVVTGEIVESDVFFNSVFAWSTAAAGEAGRFDLQSVAAHEIGHFIGLGHSALGETEVRPEGGRRVFASGAVMFPISLGRAVVEDRILQPDDIAGVSDLYPDGGFREHTGAISGKVVRGNRGVIGAHVVAFDPRTGALVGGFSLGEGGAFQVAGLTPGAHVVRVEPIDDADIDSFFSPTGIDVDFQVTFSPRLIVAPAGGASEQFDVAVRPK
ncbi:MAG TPA: matrixin family metalloprotease [Vicinamibacterales bacterium]|nr:matrixin family metalloprotease [Vicinamibacterales bacterium]